MEGDRITVELDPASGRLTYRKEGGLQFEQSTSIRGSSTQPVHFCVSLWGDAEVRVT